MEDFHDPDLIIGGPPCQGHSSLNNVTRGNDNRNDLYLTMPAMAIALNAKAVIIENVPRVVKDGGQVVQATEAIFRQAGYYVSSGVLSASELGWPQTRSRHFMIASQVKQPADITQVAHDLARSSMPLSWLIGDLENQFDKGDAMFDSVPVLSPDNVRRIDWLFDNDEYDLINSQRPKCHQNGHSYPSVYGRLRYDRPAQTLTTGFQSPGRGRYVHPSQRRVLTIREAARIQGFPDSFKFISATGGQASRGNLQKWIGDAVPSILGYTAGLIAMETLV
jgi:DNA (cytosine-5)-methyltransferase 1